MTAFPRVHLPFEVTELSLPGPLMSKAQSGKVHTRSNMQIGRTWRESYLLKVSDTADKLFLAQVRNFWRNGQIFTIQHRDYLTMRGTGGGSPIVNAATQLVASPENFGAWTVQGTPVLTSGQGDPFGGTGAYLIEDNDGAATEAVYFPVSFTGNATKAVSVFMKRDNYNAPQVALYDFTAAIFRSVATANFDGSGNITSVTGVGAYTGEDYGDGWWRISFAAPSVVAANTNRIYLYPASETPGETGRTYVFGANAWDEVSPARYSGPAVPNNDATGNRLHINGATASTANWLRGGDLFSVPVGNTNYVLEAGDSVTTQANGYAAIPITPPLFTGGAPADNAALTLSNVTMRCVILEPPTFPTTSGRGADFGELSVTFGEAL